MASADANNDQPVSGVVLDAGCQPLPGVSVSIQAPVSRAAVLTDEHGRFTVTIPHGAPVTVRARVAGFRSVERVVELDGGTRRELRIFMLVGPLSEVVATTKSDGQWVVDPDRRQESPRLRGRILDAECHPIADAVVRVGGVPPRSTGIGGYFVFDSITSGSRDLEVVAAGFIRTIVKDIAIDSKNRGYIIVPMDHGTEREQVTIYPK
jgi:hypothetical protein